MTSERAEQPAVPEQHHGVPGKALAAQREAMGWTVEQVADQLKLAVRQVIALEAGDYASLPSPAVTRGFVRAYAKILKLDAAPLVAMIEMDTPPAPATNAAAVRRDKPTTFSEVRFSPGGKRPSLPVGWIAGAVVVVVAAAAAWHFGLLSGLTHGEGAATGSANTATLPAPANGGASAPAASATVPESLQNPAVPLISVPSSAPAEPAATTAPAPATTAPAPATTNAAPAAVAPAAPAPAATTAVPAATTPAAAPAAAGANELVFTAREDSWISVSPAKGGKPLVSRLIKAGTTETVSVTEPVKVVVGNAPGVSATLRGAPVDLPGKTARISLK
jgi:cytoskeleton protein RodZ